MFIRHPFALVAHPALRTATGLLCAVLLPWASSVALADSYYQNPPQQTAPQDPTQQLLAPQQLETLVAPVALYPDPLLGQILAASTYPLELVEAQQWLQQNRNLQGQALVEAARQQNWDPSVQMLVAFPDTVALLNRDIRWTTDLGNAFLTQQADVMNAIQTLRLQARNNGRLTNTPQQVVTEETQNGQDALQIEPANPQVIYPPVYNPYSVWGQPAWGSYPAVSSYPGYGYGSYGSSGYGFGSGINVAGLFSGILNWGGWGWVLGWFTHSLSLASLFFNLLGHGFGGGGYGAGYGGGAYAGVAGPGALALWAHNPAHRLGIPYPAQYAAYRTQAFNRGVSTTRADFSRVPATSSYSRTVSNDWGHFGSPQPLRQASTQNYLPRSPEQSYRSPANVMPQRSVQGFQNSQSRPYQTASIAPRPQEAPRNFARSFSSQSAPRQEHFSAPKSSTPHFSAPHFSAPKHSGGGGHSGKSSHKR